MSCCWSECSWMPPFPSNSFLIFLSCWLNSKLFRTIKWKIQSLSMRFVSFCWYFILKTMSSWFYFHDFFFPSEIINGFDCTVAKNCTLVHDRILFSNFSVCNNSDFVHVFLYFSKKMYDVNYPDSQCVTCDFGWKMYFGSSNNCIYISVVFVSVFSFFRFFVVIFPRKTTEFHREIQPIKVQCKIVSKIVIKFKLRMLFFFF